MFPTETKFFYIKLLESHIYYTIEKVCVMKEIRIKLIKYFKAFGIVNNCLLRLEVSNLT